MNSAGWNWLGVAAIWGVTPSEGRVWTVRVWAELENTGRNSNSNVFAACFLSEA